MTMFSKNGKNHSFPPKPAEQRKLDATAMTAGIVPARYRMRYILNGLRQRNDVKTNDIDTRALTYAAYGNDVSAWQGYMNWWVNRSVGQTFAYARMCVGAPSMGGYVDYHWDAHGNNHGAMDVVGHIWLPYTIYYPPNDVVEAVTFWVSTLGDDAYRMPIIIDAELDGGQSQLRVTNRLWETAVYINEVTGIKPWIYSAQWWWNVWILPGFTKNGKTWADLFGGYIVADYYSSTAPLMPRDWTRWDIWQYTSSLPGAVYGAQSTNIDGNRTLLTPYELNKLWRVKVAEELPPVELPPVPIPLDPVYIPIVQTAASNTMVQAEP